MRTEFDAAKRRWGTAGDRAAMRRSLTNPSFSAIWRSQIKVHACDELLGGPRMSWIKEYFEI